MSSFYQIGLSDALIEALKNIKLTTPYPIQTQAIPAIFDGLDILGIAQTGSGKTLSYVLPILEMYHNMGTTKNKHIKALVLVPTRELAMQVNDVFKTISTQLPEKTKSLAVYGGVAVAEQKQAISDVEILIATPGRLLDLISTKTLSLSAVKMLVIDEADKMLNLGFKDEMTKVLGLLPKKRQNLLFSATLSDDLNLINKSLLRNPFVVKVESETENLDLIKQFAYLISEEKKGPLLRYIMKQHKIKQVLIFTSSVHKADMVSDKLNSKGIDAYAIHSKKTQNARTEALRVFSIGKTRALVATDLMSRGIDIKFLPFVINYELPRSPKDYVHRIGRTGRAESAGEAISLISPEEEHHFKVIQKKMKKSATYIDGNAIDLKGY